jgi:hypothetical protein
VVDAQAVIGAKVTPPKEQAIEGAMRELEKKEDVAACLTAMARYRQANILWRALNSLDADYQSEVQLRGLMDELDQERSAAQKEVAALTEKAKGDLIRLRIYGQLWKKETGKDWTGPRVKETEQKEV